MSGWRRNGTRRSLQESRFRGEGRGFDPAGCHVFSRRLGKSSPVRAPGLQLMPICEEIL